MRMLQVAVAIVFAGSALAGTDGSEHRGAVRLQDVPLTIGTPGETPTRIPQKSTDGREIRIRVDRIWKTGPRTHASVRVQNTADVAFNDVSIVCKAVDKQNHEIGSSRQTVDRAGFATFRPGSVANLDMVFETPAEVRGLVCDARARGLPHQID